jgi:nucleoside-diphosphate kinase
METTLVLLKPSCVQRLLIGEIIHRFERRGLHIAGLKMMQLDEPILREHYAHLADRPFFPSLAASMMASPIVALAISGVDAVQVVRTMTGSTNGREAAPGTIRGDYSMSNQQNIVHASDSTANAAIELARFFRPEEMFDYTGALQGFIYGEGEAK